VYGRGHPDILVGDQICLDSLDEYEGVIKVKILPPRRLDVPVLPLRMSSGKLMFPLCRSCCERTSEEPCDCTPGERSWIGTYHTGEVKLAVSKGYVVLRAYELHNFPPERRCVYDPANPGAGLFASYVNAFLKIKQESSGYPREAVTPAQKRAYVDDYYRREGVKLDPQRIGSNPGRRFLAKLFLNSLWGFMGMRGHKTQYELLGRGSFGRFCQRVSDPSLDLKFFTILSGDAVMVEYAKKKPLQEDPPNNNLYVAVSTTSMGRQKLYHALDAAGRGLIYCDTDSVVFKERRGHPVLRLGNYLGDLTSEVAGDQDTNYISSFVSAGAKNYAYVTTGGDEVVKVKGFTLHHANAQRVNYESIRSLVTENLRDGCIETVHPHSIRRDLRTLKVYSRDEVKKYSACITKRVFDVASYGSKPYGW
jgi:hypothetical protein